MEKEMELSTERPSLLILNEYCLLKIFEFLELDDSMNLAECCNHLRRIADRTVKIESKFTLCGTMFRKGESYIDRVLTHIGHNVSLLTINCGGSNPNFGKIINDCNILKSLHIFFCREDECKVDSTLHNFDKIELLSLWYCDLGSLKMFLKNFYKLKSFTIRYCSSNEELMTALLNNNPEMESLCCFDKYSDDSYIFELLERIPKVKRLCLNIFRTVTTTALNSLLTLNGLTKLRLTCNRNNINNVLSVLARKGIMEEMELYSIEIDDNLFDILRSFVRLQLLVIRADWPVEVKSSPIWPINLKRLRLENIEFTYLSFISTIEELKSLEYMDIQWCFTAESDIVDFNNVAKMSRNILNVMDYDNRKERLEVILPRYLFGVDPELRADSKTNLLVDSKPLRILRTNLNPVIGIYFSGLD